MTNKNGSLNVDLWEPPQDIVFEKPDLSQSQHIITLRKRQELKVLDIARNREVLKAIKEELEKAGVDFERIGLALNKAYTDEQEETEKLWQEKAALEPEDEQYPSLESSGGSGASQNRMWRKSYTCLLADEPQKGQSWIEIGEGARASYQETLLGNLSYDIAAAKNNGSEVDLRVGVGVWIPPNLPTLPGLPYGVATIRAKVRYSIVGRVRATASVANAQFIGGIGWLIDSHDLASGYAKTIVDDYGDLMDIHTTNGTAYDYKVN